MSARILGVTALGALGALALAIALPQPPSSAPALPPPVEADEDPAEIGEPVAEPAEIDEPTSQVPQPGWWVGDLHVHVSPPDTPGHATLTIERAIDAARRARLDFVILTPHTHLHLPTPGADPSTGLSAQDYVNDVAELHLLEPEADAVLEPGAAPRRPILVVAGWESTRKSPGHLGISFIDVGTVADARDPGMRAVNAGALVVVNHPFFRPVESDLPVMRGVRGDRSWRPWITDTEDAGGWNAIEVWHDRSVWIEKLHANSAERFPDTQMVRSALERWDRETLARRRRITGVGGSDAHGRLPYTVQPMRMVSVRVESADQEGLRRALLAGHVTFGRDGGPAARDFTARGDVVDDEVGVGDALRVNESVHLRWGGPAVLYENGVRLGEFEGGVVRELDPPGAFAFWRIEKPGDAFSNMIYANLPE